MLPILGLAKAVAQKSTQKLLDRLLGKCIDQKSSLNIHFIIVLLQEFYFNGKHCAVLLEFSMICTMA